MVKLQSVLHRSALGIYDFGGLFRKSFKDFVKLDSEHCLDVEDAFNIYKFNMCESSKISLSPKMADLLLIE